MKDVKSQICDFVERQIWNSLVTNDSDLKAATWYIWDTWKKQETCDSLKIFIYSPLLEISGYVKEWEDEK